MKGFAAAFKIASEIILSNESDPPAARRIITENIHYCQSQLRHDERNKYLHEQLLAYQAALDAMYQQGER